MRIQMIQCSIRLLAPLPSTLVHALDLFVSATRALVLLRARNGDERVHLGQWMRVLLGSATDGRTRSRVEAYLTGTRPRGGDRSRRGHGGPGGIAVGPVGQAMRVSGVLLRPMWIARGRMALILGHVVVLRRVRRIRRVGRTRRGDGRIYGYVGVRLDVRCIMMVILMPIL